MPTDVDVTALTLKASPVSGDIVLIQDSAASNAFKKTTVGALASAGSVASFNGRTGAVSPAQGDYPASLIPGTTTNNNATAGNIGELIESEILAGSAVVIPTGFARNVTSISLTAGDWNVWGNVAAVPIAGGNTSNVIGWTSDVSATVPTMPNKGGYTQMPYGSSTSSLVVIPVGVRRFSLASTTTIYLSTYVAYAGASLSVYGYIGARRVR